MPRRSNRSAPLGIGAGAFASLLAVLCVLAPTAAHAQATPVVVALEVEGTIDPAVDAYLRDGLQRAAEIDADILLIRLDTPGGLLESTRTIVRQMLGSDIPIVVWVAPEGARAASAGVFVTMAAHVAAMAPATHIGAATPITMGGGGPENGDEADGGERADGAPDNQEAMRRKMMQDTQAFARSIAEARDRPADWIERTVTEARSATSREALEAGAIDLIVGSEEELLTALDGLETQVDGAPRVLELTGARIVRHEMTLGQRFLHFLAHPTIAFFLLLFGVVAIYFELAQPGGYIAGALGAIALILAIISFQIVPFHTGGLLLLLLGLVLVVVEAFVPAGGLLAIGGIVSLVAGALLLFETPELTARPSPWVTGVGAAVAGLCAIGIGVLVVRAQREPTQVGELVGAVGYVDEPLRPEGRVHVRGELWRARLRDERDGPVDPGDEIEVLAKDGTWLLVEPTGDSTSRETSARRDETAPAEETT